MKSRSSQAQLLKITSLEVARNSYEIFSRVLQTVTHIYDTNMLILNSQIQQFSYIK